ncbi:MAG: glycosyltransferase family 2 protein [Bacteroidia bacterium]|nr:glycosyltransferase family 2 protein [Bacteroidia bacterium]
MPKISIVIPCYFNEHNIPVTFPVLLENEKKFPEDVNFEYIFVDDGSKDGTFHALMKVYEQHPEKVKVIKLARNFGANNASYCGICHSTGDCCVVLAADLQDPPELIAQLYQHWLKGYKLVLAQKTNREDSWITKFFSNTYHNLIRNYVLTNAPKGGFDLWLFDKQLRDVLIQMNEKNFYLPYLFIWMGYEYVSIPYTRRKREIGKSGWTLSKKIKSFIDSFVSFTYLPLRLISIAGIILGLLALIYGGMIIYSKITSKIPTQGWSSMMVVVLFTSSFIMISLGIIGEYLYRTLDAARNRPNYIIDKVFETKKEK